MSRSSSDRSDIFSSIYVLNANASGEDLENYGMNGLPPVEIDDFYHDGKYRIIHKLGNGGSSTVWIAQRTTDNKLHALKFLSCRASARSHEATKMRQINAVSALLRSYVPRLIDSFSINGPNCPPGRKHNVLVFELLGPSVSNLSFECCRLHPGIVQTLMFQATKALIELHKANIVHLDLTPRNILLKLNPTICTLSPDSLYRMFGRSRGIEVERLDKRDPKPHAPAKYFASIDFTLQSQYLHPSPTLIDFGESADFRVRSKLRTIPPMYASPEAIFEDKVDPSCDVWSLGCIIFKARAGYDLFPGDSWAPDQVEQVVQQMVFRLGCGPPFKHWKHARFDGRGGVILPHTYELRSGSKPKTWIENIKCHYYPPLKQSVRQIRDRPAEAETNNIFWNIGNHYRGRCNIRPEDDAKYPRIPPQEADLLYDLLSKIFVWDPSNRITAAELLRHPWFQLST